MNLGYATPQAVRPRPVTAFVNANRITLFLAAALLIVAIPFAVWIWPTRYSYETTGKDVVRIDRFSGKAERLTEWGWYPLQFDGNPKPPPGFLPEGQKPPPL